MFYVSQNSEIYNEEDDLEMKNWLKELFGVEKPIIGMCHMMPLPGDPSYDNVKGMHFVYEQARHDVIALQEGGVDGILFSNEFSLPYLTKVETVTVASMAAIISELKYEVTVPFGVDVLWDPKASIDLAAAVEAKFVREVFTGVYAGDFGLWNTNFGEVARHKHNIGADNVRLLFNIVPESASYIGARKIEDIARSTVFNTKPDGLCVSGLTAGSQVSAELLQYIKEKVTDVPLFANTGVNPDNVEKLFSLVDGAVVGTFFKEEGKFMNRVDSARVKLLMGKVRTLRDK